MINDLKLIENDIIRFIRNEYYYNYKVDKKTFLDYPLTTFYMNCYSRAYEILRRNIEKVLSNLTIKDLKEKAKNKNYDVYYILSKILDDYINNIILETLSFINLDAMNEVNNIIKEF